MINKINIVEVPINELRVSEYNPRKHSTEQVEQLKESITRFGLVDPLIVNGASERKNVLIGGHFRLKVAKELGYETVPVVFINIPDLNKEKELNLRLNKNTGDFDLDLLAQFDETFLADIGFDSEELDNIFPTEEDVEEFNLQKQLEKLNILNITVQNGDIYELDGSRVQCGDSTNLEDVIKLMNGEKADMVFTDPPYILDYLKKKTKNMDGGFGANNNRRYLGTDELFEK